MSAEFDALDWLFLIVASIVLPWVIWKHNRGWDGKKKDRNPKARRDEDPIPFDEIP